MDWRRIAIDIPGEVIVTWGRISEYSSRKITRGPDAGKLLIERNLECMRNWSKDQISEIFDDQGKLKKIRRPKYGIFRGKLTDDNPSARVEMVKNTRKYVVSALKSIFKHEKYIDRDLRMLPNDQYMAIAEDFTSKDAILTKFSEGVLHSFDRRRSNQEIREQREQYGRRYADDIFPQRLAQQNPWLGRYDSDEEWYDYDEW